MPDIQQMTTESDYDAALARVSELMDALTGQHGQTEDANHPARVELDALVDSIEAYENEHYPMEQSEAATTTYYPLHPRPELVEGLSIDVSPATRHIA